MGRRITSPVMVGRASEVAALEALLAEARSGARFVAISGEAGIGKTRLLSALMVVAGERGMRVFAGGSPVAVGGQPIPFAAVTQALRSLIRSLDARRLPQFLGAARSDLARLLPELASPDGDALPPDPRDMARLFEAVLLVLERASVPNGALVVLEDLHWADPATWSLVGHLCRNLGSTPVLLAVSYRWGDADVGPLSDAVRELARLPGAEHIQLEPLGPNDARALLQALPDLRCSERDMSLIVHRSDGIPFYLEELADQVGGPTGGVPPGSIRAAVAARSSLLTPPSRLVTDLVATSDGPIDVRLLRAATGLTESDLTDALRGSMAAQLLVSTNVASRLVDVRHVLVREVLVAGLVPGEAARLHGSLAAATEAHPDWAGSSELERSSRLANHWLAAGERQRALPALLRAGDSARRALAFQDADDAYRRAIEIVGGGEPPMPPDAWRDVLADAAAVARLAGAPDRAVVLQERIIAAYGHEPHDALAMARIRLGRYLAEAGQPEAAARQLREVATVARAPVIRARCALELARVLTATHQYAEAADQASLARDMAVGSGDLHEAARATAALGVALTMTGRHAEALAALSEARGLGDMEGRAEGSPAGASRPSRFPDSLLGHADRATILALAGDPVGASRAALDGSAAARRLGVAGSWAAVLAAMAARELMRIGRWDDAEAALTDGPDADGAPAAPARVVRALLAVRRGDLSHAETALASTEVTDLHDTPGSGWVGLHALATAELALARSSFDVARSAVTDGLARSEGDPDPLQRAELASLGVRIEADGVIQARDRRDAGAVAAGDSGAMILFATGCSELAGTPDPGLAPWVAASRARLDAELGRLRGIPDPDRWDVAVRTADATPDAFGQAYVRYRLAEAMLAEGRGRTPAASALQDCVAIARRLGAAALLEEAQRLAIRARIQLDLAATVTQAPGSPTPRDAARGLGLSDREVDVLELLALGLTDRDIGSRLFITEKTAGHHVSHILTKLTVTRRGEAAAVAHRLGVVGAAGSGPGG